MDRTFEDYGDLFFRMFLKNILFYFKLIFFLSFQMILIR
jgi:hypothetical protein